MGSKYEVETTSIARVLESDQGYILLWIDGAFESATFKIPTKEADTFIGPDALDCRAILTPREREILSGEADVSDNYRYRVVSRVREKIEQLGDDLAVLDEHHQKLANELREAVCEDDNE